MHSACQDGRTRTPAHMHGTHRTQAQGSVLPHPEHQELCWAEIHVTVSPGRQPAGVSRAGLRSCDLRPRTDGVRAPNGRQEPYLCEKTARLAYQSVRGHVDHRTLPPTLNLPCCVRICTRVTS